MSIFRERATNHLVHETLRELLTAITNAKPRLGDKNATAVWARFVKTAKHTKRALKSADPELLYPDVLSNIATCLGNMKQALVTFLNDGISDALTAAGDSLLATLHALPRRSFPKVEESFAEELGVFHDAATNHLSVIEDNADAVRDDFETLSARVDATGGKLTEFEAVLEEQKSRVDGIITEHQNDYSTERERHNTEFNNRLSKVDEDADERLQQIVEATSERLRAADEKLDTLTEQLEEARRIVGTLGNTGLTGNYQITANQEQRAADLFRWFAVGAYVLMVIGAGFLIAKIDGPSFSWEVALFRIATVGGALGAPAWYFGKESARHRAVQHRNRRIELELASLAPYLEELPDEKRNEILAKLAERYFGAEHDDTNDGKGIRIDLDSAHAVKVWKELLQLKRFLSP